MTSRHLRSILLGLRPESIAGMKSGDASAVRRAVDTLIRTRAVSPLEVRDLERAIDLLSRTPDSVEAWMRAVQAAAPPKTSSARSTSTPPTGSSRRSAAEILLDQTLADARRGSGGARGRGVLQPGTYSKTARATAEEVLGSQALPFFDLYTRLAQLAARPERSPKSHLLLLEIQRATGQLFRSSALRDHPMSSEAAHEVSLLVSDLSALLQRPGKPDEDDLARAGALYRGMVERIALDQRIDLRPIEQEDESFVAFRAMSERERDLLELADEDPDSHAALQHRRSLFETGILLVDDRVRETTRLRMQAREPGAWLTQRVYLLGQVVTIGGSPRFMDHETGRFEDTAEARADLRVYDFDGTVSTYDEYVEKRRSHFAALDRITRASTSDATHFLSDDRFDSLRRLDDDLEAEGPIRSKADRGRRAGALRDAQDRALSNLIDQAKGEGTFRYVALTDDKNKDEPMTRHLPTVLYGDHRIVADGPFKGIFLDDLVNLAGRMVEGAAYRIDRSGESRVVRAPSDREPYVTVASDRDPPRLFLQLPTRRGRMSDADRDDAEPRGEWTVLRQRLRSLSKKIPSVTYVAGSKNSAFYFDPKDLDSVRHAVRAPLFSSAATAFLKKHFEDTARAEHAAAAQNLGAFSARAVSGFKSKEELSLILGHEVTDDVLWPVQMRGIAWLEAKGDAGVLGLDPGMGKTLIAIRVMQKWMQTGVTSGRGKKKFLYVCQPSLKGGVQEEIKKFLVPDAAKNLLKSLTVLSYGEFQARADSGRIKPHEYALVFFDEAQHLTGNASSRSRAAVSFDHPHKICLTASTMEEDPADAYDLYCIVNNVRAFRSRDDEDPKATAEAAKARADFRRLVCESVGGRVVGIRHDNEHAARDYLSFLKQHFFLANKREAKHTATGEASRSLRPFVSKVVEIRGDSENGSLDADAVALKKLSAAYVALAESASLTPVIKGVVSLYAHKGKRNRARGADPEAPGVYSFFSRQGGSAEGRRALERIFNLPDVPARVSEGGTLDEGTSNESGAPLLSFNPKLRKASEILLDEASRRHTRCLVWAEERQMVEHSARKLSETVPGIHAACLADQIVLYQHGEPVSGTYLPQELEALGHRGFDLPIVEKADGTEGRRSAWRQRVLETLSKDPKIATLSLVRTTYQTGFNLQRFNTVIHLDFASGSSQSLIQSRDRAWREGQAEEVHEYFLKIPLQGVRNAFLGSIDDLGDAKRQCEQDIFEASMRQAEHVDLASEWFEGTLHLRASLLHLRNRTRLLEGTAPDVPLPLPIYRWDAEGAMRRTDFDDGPPTETVVFDESDPSDHEIPSIGRARKLV